MAHKLENILQRSDTWRGRQPRVRPGGGIPSGQRPLDALLHTGGWPAAGLSELLVTGPGLGELELLLPALRRQQARGDWLFWLDPPWELYAPALVDAHIDLERLLVCRSRNTDELMWVAGQVLRHPGCGGLLCWLGDRAVSYARLRKLQLAAAEHGAPGFFFRSAKLAEQHSPAALRLALEGTDAGLRLQILKQRGGGAGQSLELQREYPLTAPPAPRSWPVTRRQSRLPRLRPLPEAQAALALAPGREWRVQP